MSRTARQLTENTQLKLLQPDEHCGAIPVKLSAQGVHTEKAPRGSDPGVLLAFTGPDGDRWALVLTQKGARALQFGLRDAVDAAVLIPTDVST